ncbi:sugar kinase [Rhodobacter sp. NSM]|uniref:sugar kinase n=1 Tax=Rhodobacter sp. NSM TaxID=3457501 RepID=UPI003FD41787
MPAGSLRKHIVSVGECMVEMAPTGDGTYAMGFAGDTLNTAWYLRRALPSGMQVDYLTAVGTDAISGRMLAFLEEAGLGTDRIARIPDRTVGLYLIEIANGERSFAYWRGQSAAKLLARDAAALEAGLADASVIYFSGITLAILDPADRARLIEALAAARAAGSTVAFDPNLRPRLWPDAAAMCAAISEAARHADIVLPSHEDEATFFGDTDAEATAARYAEAGAGLVVVKDGPGPMITLSAEGRQSHPPEAVSRVVDTTAAGDSFNAGFLAAHLTGEPLAEAVRAGARLAARVIGARGALVD